MKVASIPFIQGRNGSPDPDGKKYGIGIHATENPNGASAWQEAQYATHRTDGVGAHFYGDQHDVIQSIDTDQCVGHAGSAESKNHTIAAEFRGWSDKPRSWWIENTAWDLWGIVFAAVIAHHWPDGSFQLRFATPDELKADPHTRAFYTHDTMRRAWGHTTHTDPGKNFPEDVLIEHVRKHLGYGYEQGTDRAVIEPGKTLAPQVMVRQGHADAETVKFVQGTVGARRDGLYGPKTAAKVAEYQAAHRIPHSVRQDGTGDGIWGPWCWAWWAAKVA